MSKGYLSPTKIHEDLNIYIKLIEDLKLEIANPQNLDLQKGIKEYFIDEKSLNWINNEILELREVCEFAQMNSYLIKFGIDY